MEMLQKPSFLNFFLETKCLLYSSVFFRKSNKPFVSLNEYTFFCQVLETYGDEDRIGNKLMGCINKAPWEAACKKKFKYHVDGWDFVMSTIISEWEDRMKDQNYHPYRNVRLGEGDNWKVSLCVLLYTF